MIGGEGFGGQFPLVKTEAEAGPGRGIRGVPEDCARGERDDGKAAFEDRERVHGLQAGGVPIEDRGTELEEPGGRGFEAGVGLGAAEFRLAEADAEVEAAQAEFEIL